VPSEVDEKLCGESDPVAHARVLARWKAESVSRKHPSSIVLGCDQVMWNGEQIHGKPKDAEAHFNVLKSLRGQEHWLHTAYCLCSPAGLEEQVVTTRLRVRQDLSDDEIQAYVDTKEGRYCAGGYAIEGHGAWLFSEVEGDWTNIIGLPLFEVIGSLRRLGWKYGG
jgi:septum formation protein